MTKKLLVAVLGITIVTAFGCGKKTDMNESNINNTNATSVVSEDAMTKATEGVMQLGEKFSIGEYADVQYPKGYYPEREDACLFIKQKEKKSIIATRKDADVSNVAEVSFDDEFTKLVEKPMSVGSMNMLEAAQNNLRGCKLTVSSKENCNINGFEAIRFTGNAVNEPITSGQSVYGGVNCYVYGYIFKTSKEVYSLFGVVTDKEQSKALIDEITTDVDAMMNTVEEVIR